MGSNNSLGMELDDIFSHFFLTVLMYIADDMSDV